MEKNTNLIFNAAKTIYEYPGTDEEFKAKLVKMFPELEPEDEKFERIVLDAPFKHEADYKFVKAYLKKQKEQKPAEWSEKDSAMLCDIARYIAGEGASSGITKQERIDFLYGLRKRFNLQPNQEWSEEEEYVISKFLNWIQIVNPTSPIFKKLPKKQFIERLKSLRPRYIYYTLDAPLAFDKDMNPIYPPINHWKPSEEQMKALEDAFRKDGGNEYRKVINSLYCDLQKLL